jgi:streptogramin lyase
VILAMTRTHRCLIGIATALALAGCGLGGTSKEHRPAVASTSHAASPGPHVVATLDVTSANQVVVTPTHLWFLGGPSGVITEVDPATNSVVRVVRPPHPTGFGTYAGGSLWVASFLDDAVMQLDAGTGQEVRTIERSASAPWNGPVGIASTGTDLWVVNHHSSMLVRLDRRTGEVLGKSTLPGRKPGGPMVLGGEVWIPIVKGGLVVRVNRYTGRPDGPPVAIGTGVCGGSSVAAGQLWFTSLDDEKLGCHEGASRFDPRTGTTSPVGNGVQLSEFAQVGADVWASDQDHTIYRVDLATGALTPAMTLDGHAEVSHLASAFGSLWVLRPETNQVIRIDTAS